MQLQDLVRSQGEPRWTVVVDGLLAVGVLVWVVVLAVTEPADVLRIGVPLALAVVVVARIVVLVEHVQRWRELGPDQAPAPVAPGPSDSASEASQAA